MEFTGTGHICVFLFVFIQYFVVLRDCICHVWAKPSYSPAAFVAVFTKFSFTANGIFPFRGASHVFF